MRRKGISLLGVFIFLSICSFAQSTATIKGFVYDKKTGEAMLYTNVRVVGTKFGAQTDVNGYFTIAQLAPGTYTIMATQLGFDTATATLTVAAGQVYTQKLYMNESEVQLSDVEINAKKTEKITQIDAGTTTIAPQDIKLLPSTGGEPDVTQFLQVVPGVVFTGDQGGQLYIRGGSPAQTGILLDGVTIYNPFHSIGLYSVFETETIRNVDVQTAAFNAEHGNRTSAIMEVHTIDGNKNRTSGLLSISPLMARAMLEGPILKPKNDGASITYVLSVKNCFLDQTSKSIYGGLGEPFKSGLPYSFTDLYGKVTVNGDNGSKFNIFGFSFNDNANLLNSETHETAAEFNWKAVGVGTTFVLSPSGSSTLIDGKFAYSKYTITGNEVGLPERNSGINGFETGLNFTNYLPGYSEIKYGLEVSGFSTTLTYPLTDIITGKQYTSTLNRQNTLAGVYVTFRKDFSDKFIMEPSIRFQYYSGLSKISPEPRIGLKYNITENLRLKAAAGVYSQNIISTKSDRDIVNFFTGFILSPDETIKDPDGNTINTNLETAYHFLAGVEIDIHRVELNIEPWIKVFGQDITFNRSKLHESDPNFVAGSGKAVGVDLSAKYSYNRVYLWGVVSYQSVEFTNLGADGLKQTYPAPFDRRLNINMLAAYTTGKKKDWELSARYNVGSPFPFTQTQGYFENPPIPNINTNIPATNGSINILYANEINGGRLSWYHRLDLSVKKIFELRHNTKLDATVSVINVYDRNNIFYVNRLTNTRVYQFPIFPSANVTLHF